MTDAVATRDGFTRTVRIEAGEQDLFCLIKPQTDLESRFKAWDTDAQEFIRVEGWNVCVFDLDDARI